MRVQSQNISKYGPKVNFEFSHIFGIFNTYFLSYLKDLVHKKCAHVKMDLWIAKYQYFVQILNF